MKEEGLVYDARSGGFLHVRRDDGQIIIDKEPCQHEHFIPMIVLAE